MISLTQVKQVAEEKEGLRRRLMGLERLILRGNTMKGGGELSMSVLVRF